MQQIAVQEPVTLPEATTPTEAAMPAEIAAPPAAQPPAAVDPAVPAEVAATIKVVLSLTRNMPAVYKAQLISDLATSLGKDLTVSVPGPRRSLRGICADLGPAPSAEEIDEARREAWSNFPREDI